MLFYYLGVTNKPVFKSGKELIYQTKMAWSKTSGIETIGVGSYMHIYTYIKYVYNNNNQLYYHQF